MSLYKVPQGFHFVETEPNQCNVSFVVDISCNTFSTATIVGPLGKLVTECC